MLRVKLGARAPLDATEKPETFLFLAPASRNTRHFVKVKDVMKYVPCLSRFCGQM